MAQEKVEDQTMEKIVSLAKRRGFVFPACEIYGGLGSSFSYGPYGTALKNNIKALWLKRFVDSRDDMYAIDGPIILHPALWKASGHTEGFNDAMVDCKKCKKRFRADHLVEEATGKDHEGDLEKLNTALAAGIPCPNCKAQQWTEARFFSLMFKTDMNGLDEPVYLRPETAGAIFVEFNNILDTMRPKLPFGIAQIGKAFRNEIVTGNFVFRVREFEQMEIEYFIDPEKEWEDVFENLLKEQEAFCRDLGLAEGSFTRREHAPEKLSHYSRKTVDMEYNFPFGVKELFGLAHRGDFDLKVHSEHSGKKLEFFDAVSNRRFIPHVIEPSFGVERALLATLHAAYNEETLEGGEERAVLKLPYQLAPVKVAIFPLLKNKEPLVEKAREIYSELRSVITCEFDDNGNIGKRYRRQDEIGTPFCVTVDFDTLENNEVTVRERDSMKQEKVSVFGLKEYLQARLK
ncbi:MAG: glycine--tRNA ligase [bacterium]|nr:glycine--tRNA ligase [bacterium]